MANSKIGRNWLLVSDKKGIVAEWDMKKCAKHEYIIKNYILLGKIVLSSLVRD